MLQHASDELKNNENVVTIAVTHDGHALQYVSTNNQKSNIDVVLTALRQNPSALNYISQDFIVAATTRYH